MRLRKAAHESKLTLDLKRPWDRSSTPPSLRRTVTVVLENRTAWLDRDLAKLVRRVVAIEEVPPGRLTLTVTYGRGGSGCSGEAGYGNWRAVVRVPSPAVVKQWSSTFPKVDFCHVVAHEIGHAVFGKKHAEMGFHYRRGEYSNKVFAWAKALTVRPKAEPKAPGRDKKREAELKRAEANHRESLALMKKSHGEVHPSVAMALNNLGVVLNERGDPAGAERVLREALAMNRRLLGDDHPWEAASESERVAKEHQFKELIQ